MVLYKYVRKNYDSEDAQKLQRQRLISWRREAATVRIERPTRLDRARSLGYKAKAGIVLLRQRVTKGMHVRAHDLGGRRSKHASERMNLNLNYQSIAQRRAAEKFANLVVLNSYKVGEDGQLIWFEVILVDPRNPSVMADQTLGAFAKSAQRGRALRGLTMADRRSRGLLSKGKGADKLRPSKTANWKRRNTSYLERESRRFVR